MKVFTGEIPENPHEKPRPRRYSDSCDLQDDAVYAAVEEYRQSILNQCREVDIDKLLMEYDQYSVNWQSNRTIPTSEYFNTKLMTPGQFIQEQIQQEVKDGKQL